MTVVFYQKLNSFWMEQLEAVKGDFPHITFVHERDQAERMIPQADVLICGAVDDSLFARAENLKAVIVPFAGVDHLPYHLLTPRNVRVANSHGNARFVAERTMALLLAWYGKVMKYHQDLSENRWHGFWVGKGLDDTWETIQGKSCSILGAGEIGRYLARYLKAFDCEVIALKKKREAEIFSCYDLVVYDIDEAIDRGEVIIVALPATEETRGIINGKRLARMQGKFLVNIGRGELLEEEACYRALADGTLKGAAIDCWYSYPKDGVIGPPSRFPFHELPNVILSPHVAGYTREAAELNIRQAFINLRMFLAEGSFLYEVDTRHAY